MIRLGPAHSTGADIEGCSPHTGLSLQQECATPRDAAALPPPLPRGTRGPCCPPPRGAAAALAPQGNGAGDTLAAVTAAAAAAACTCAICSKCAARASTDGLRGGTPAASCPASSTHTACPAVGVAGALGRTELPPALAGTGRRTRDGEGGGGGSAGGGGSTDGEKGEACSMLKPRGAAGLHTGGVRGGVRKALTVSWRGGVAEAAVSASACAAHTGVVAAPADTCRSSRPCCLTAWEVLAVAPAAAAAAAAVAPAEAETALGMSSGSAKHIPADDGDRRSRGVANELDGRGRGEAHEARARAASASQPPLAGGGGEAAGDNEVGAEGVEPGAQQMDSCRTSSGACGTASCACACGTCGTCSCVWSCGELRCWDGITPLQHAAGLAGLTATSNAACSTGAAAAGAAGGDAAGAATAASSAACCRGLKRPGSTGSTPWLGLLALLPQAGGGGSHTSPSGSSGVDDSGAPSAKPLVLLQPSDCGCGCCDSSSLSSCTWGLSMPTLVEDTCFAGGEPAATPQGVVDDRWHTVAVLASAAAGDADTERAAPCDRVCSTRAASDMGSAPRLRAGIADAGDTAEPLCTLPTRPPLLPLLGVFTTATGCCRCCWCWCSGPRDASGAGTRGPL